MAALSTTRRDGTDRDDRSGRRRGRRGQEHQGIDHNLPQGAPQAFAQAVIDVER
jgi:hypothetical protein